MESYMRMMQMEELYRIPTGNLQYSLYNTKVVCYN